jgi:hypothetical protein
METSEPNPGISFDRAAYADKREGGPPCANCSRPLGEQYWQWQTRPICGDCRGRLTELLAESQSSKSFGRAALLGGGTALACGVGYAVFVAVTHIQLALVTIGIAFVVARVIRRCSGGIGGRKYQILAVALTYVASAMGYAPGVYGGFKSAAAEHSSSSRSSSATSTDDDGAPSDHRRGGPGATLTALALFFAFTLAAPVLAATEAPIGLLIVGFGLWEAWKLSRGLPLTLDGPYRATPATGPPAG